MSYFLGIDAGGSNCRARLIDSEGNVIGTGQGGTANARIGLEALYTTLCAVSNQAIAEAGLSSMQVETIRAGMGIAGISRPGVRDALERFAFPFASVNYGTDAFIANLGLNRPTVRARSQGCMRSANPPTSVQRLAPRSKIVSMNRSICWTASSTIERAMASSASA